MYSSFSAVSISVIVLHFLCPHIIASSLPIIDLGYAIHQATINASDTPYYNFSNIRYGQAPVGPLRFAPPLPPCGRNTTINNGQRGVIPPQANPAWVTIAALFLATYLTGQNISKYQNEPYEFSILSNISTSAADSLTSEDCLFLDIIVPTKIFDAVHTKHSKPVSKGAPVLVWIYGGGYTAGSKTSAGSPASLVARSQLHDSEGVIFVAMNYRLGLFGWLSGSDEITSNIGLLDQRLALEWVKCNIHLFGGDPSRVTVMGESAGAGSIMHHITSYGGNRGPVPFYQAIPQSPAFQIFVPEQSRALLAQVYGNASLLANQSITCADQLRALRFEVLAAVNSLMVGRSSYGSFSFGPVVDPYPNSYVPDLPLRLVAQNKFHKVGLMVGHNLNEGLLFTPPYLDTQAEEDSQFAQLFPTADPKIISYIIDALYPPIFNGSYGYMDAIGRSSRAISDFTVNCNAYYLAKKLSPGYGYLFSVPPGLHGGDVPYTFFNGEQTTADQGVPPYPAVAAIFQRYLTQFAMTGIPSAEGYQTFAQYGHNSTITGINFLGIGSQMKDPAAVKACQFWAEAPYYKVGS